MTLLWRTFLVRLLVATLLLVWPPSESKVLCISPTGHEAIEDWAAPCCAPNDGPSGTALSEPSPCQGCTDYPLAPTIELDHSQPDSSQAVSFLNSAIVVVVSAGPAPGLSIEVTPGLDRWFDPLSSEPQITSLRC